MQFKGIVHTSVADPERFDADPDPTLHADADPDPDPKLVYVARKRKQFSSKSSTFFLRTLTKLVM